MRTLTYTGDAGTRILEGHEFPRGEPVEVPDKDATRIMGGPHADEFTDTTPGGRAAPKKED